ncbi:hypothetical protein IE4872_PC00071 (plasmid) [Rhizobium gallicum]|uniref:Uncharacterized protein n=1 Tax=Rhizobium gallicum TaxID=56730 RepID=A0A1L5NQF2_9HYPH|nr:hypothetical protein IE4872_PC00071 [Rhizobium gallicum]
MVNHLVKRPFERSLAIFKTLCADNDVAWVLITYGPQSSEGITILRSSSISSTCRS